MITKIVLKKIEDIKRQVIIMSEKFKITPMTRIFAESEDGQSFILTNNQVVTFDDLQDEDKGCLVNIVQKTMSPELPIMVLTKHEFFGKVKTKIDLEEVKGFNHLC